MTVACGKFSQSIKSSCGCFAPCNLVLKVTYFDTQVVECTSKSEDEAYFALHDCDFDLQRAIVKLIEEQDQVII